MGDYRRTLRALYSAAGKNPLVRGSAAPSMDFEWRSVNGLLASKGEPVRRIKCESDFELWSTCFGQLWTPFGATQAFVTQVVAEMNALVYDSSLRNTGAGCTIIDVGANIGAFARY